ncbi:MAG: peptidoglycan bridge formation glycyltransferase FemA/FemB family protein [Candidatus Gottesmanbacteria bacterium]|nr:peptidoglycan bridge formation glycyltransferase FemA/FemB family protein [Candidatus Gottesmanbacteria bacterium]
MTNHPLQSPAWGKFRKAMGIDVVRLNDWQLTFHKIPYTPWTVGYFPKGPAPTKKMIDELLALGKQKNAIFIQLEPNIINKFQISNFKFQILRPSHHPLFTKYTFVLDLTKSEEELLSAMHPKTRYNIKVAQKHNVKIAEDNSPAAFKEYLRLTEETTSRQGFYAHNKNYHKTVWEIMHKEDIAHLFTASYESEVLSAWIVFVWGDTVYYPYGSSSRNHREVMAPTLLLWEIAKWAKQKGLKHFDLWGAMGPPSADGPDVNDPWYGFHRFKQGFNPRLVEFSGSFDLVVKPLLYSFYTLADTLRWKFLKLTH